MRRCSKAMSARRMRRESPLTASPCPQRAWLFQTTIRSRILKFGDIRYSIAGRLYLAEGVMHCKPCQVARSGGARSTAEVLLALIVLLSMATGCGSSSRSLPPPPDFSLALSQASVSAQVGTATTPVTITVNGQSGFTGSVNVSLQGVPDGVTVSPSSSFAVAAGANQPVAFDLADSTVIGPAVITVSATGGGHSHSAQITLTAESLVRTYQSGTRLYIESGNTVDVARIGLETTWGGSIVEVSVNGTEFVNRHDTGREGGTVGRLRS